ncbi:Protein Enabled-like [Manis pentadactyla]|nr:Protein Enabled-like [Manis pentadactyla]
MRPVPPPRDLAGPRSARAGGGASGSRAQPLKAWGSDCSKGGAGRTQVSASPAPLRLSGEGPRRDALSAPAPTPLHLAAAQHYRSQGSSYDPRPQQIGDSRRRPPSRELQEYLLLSDSSPCCCSARPFGSQGGAQGEPGPSRPHLAFGSLTPRLW